MTTSGDHGPEMSLTWLLDDETCEGIIRCDEVDAGLEALAVFARQVRDLGDEPSPAASPALQALIASGGTQRRGAIVRSRMFADRSMTANGRVASLGFAAKLGLGTAAAALGMAGAAAAGALPDRADQALRNAVEAVTPVEFTEPDADPTDFGERVSNDATGASDGEPGVDGDTISDEAPGAVYRPADPAGAALDRAGETPAASHLPTDVPAPQGDKPTEASGSAPADPSTTPTTGPDSGGASGNHAPPDAPPAPPDARG